MAASASSWLSQNINISITLITEFLKIVMLIFYRFDTRAAFNNYFHCQTSLSWWINSCLDRLFKYLPVLSLFIITLIEISSVTLNQMCWLFINILMEKREKLNFTSKVAMTDLAIYYTVQHLSALLDISLAPRYDITLSVRPTLRIPLGLSWRICGVTTFPLPLWVSQSSGDPSGQWGSSAWELEPGQIT